MFISQITKSVEPLNSILNKKIVEDDKRILKVFFFNDNFMLRITIDKFLQEITTDIVDLENFISYPLSPFVSEFNAIGDKGVVHNIIDCLAKAIGKYKLKLLDVTLLKEKIKNYEANNKRKWLAFGIPEENCYLIEKLNVAQTKDIKKVMKKVV